MKSPSFSFNLLLVLLIPYIIQKKISIKVQLKNARQASFLFRHGGTTVSIIGNELGDSSSRSEQGCLHFT